MSDEQPVAQTCLRPGGVLLATLHGAHSWKSADPALKSEVEARGFVYRTGPRTTGLPDYCMVAFHSEDCLCRQWARFFDVAGFHEKARYGVQDIAVLRRRAD